MVGLTLALALAQGGMKVALADPMTPAQLLDERFDGRVSALAFASVRMLRTLGAVGCARARRAADQRHPGQRRRAGRASRRRSRCISIIARSARSWAISSRTGTSGARCIQAARSAPRYRVPSRRRGRSARRCGDGIGDARTSRTAERSRARSRSRPRAGSPRSARRKASAPSPGIIRRSASSPRSSMSIRTTASPTSTSCPRVRSPFCR